MAGPGHGFFKAIWLAVVLSLSILQPGVAQPPPRKIALLVQNDAYPDAEPAKLAGEDASILADLLKADGFEVELKRNVDRHQLRSSVEAFVARMTPGAVALFYYRGIGIQASRLNYLIPVDGSIWSEEDVRREGTSLDRLMADLDRHGAAVKIAIVDAARPNPFERRFRLYAAGLAPLGTPKGSLVIFAEALNTVGDPGRATPFLKELVAQLEGAGDAESAFARTRESLAKLSNGRQLPWVASTLAAPFAFPKATGPGTKPVSTAQGKPSAPSPSPPAAPPPTQAPLPTPIPPKPFAKPAEVPAGVPPATAQATPAAPPSQAPQPAPTPPKPPAHPPAAPTGAPPSKPADQAKPPAPTQATPPVPPPGQTSRPPDAVQPKPRPKPAAPIEPVKPPATQPPAARPPAARPPAALASPNPPAKPVHASRPGTVFRDCRGCPEMTVLAPGTFRMGSGTTPFDRPVHSVTIGKPFAMALTVVTRDEWAFCVDGGGCTARPKVEAAGSQPVVDVNWFDAKRYVEFLSKKTGKTYRLPTEAEWEYAARGGTTTAFAWGDAPGVGHANCTDCGNKSGRPEIEPVRTYPTNGFGLYDMAGNVAEWLQDCWTLTYRDAPTDGSAPQVPSCGMRVLRGGSFETTSAYVKPTARFRFEAEARSKSIGFRLARDLE